MGKFKIYRNVFIIVLVFLICVFITGCKGKQTNEDNILDKNITVMEPNKADTGTTTTTNETGGSKTVTEMEENQEEDIDQNKNLTEENSAVTESAPPAAVKEQAPSEAAQDLKAQGFDYNYDTLTYDLVWSDEFEYEGLPDSTKWSYDTGGGGWGNNELEYYTDQNAAVKDGNLIIEARKEDYKYRDYTSARLVTKGKGDWLYGRIEVKAKLPGGTGTWPAIWMLPTDEEYGVWPSSGEIDIMEHVGYDQDIIHATIHTKSYYFQINTQKTATKSVKGASEDFHIYSVEWLPDKIMAYIDNVLYFTFDPKEYKTVQTYKEWPFDQRFHLLLNIAVGGNWGGAKGVDDTIFPQKMIVDYVRVYQSKEINEITGQSIDTK